MKLSTLLLAACLLFLLTACTSTDDDGDPTVSPTNSATPTAEASPTQASASPTPAATTEPSSTVTPAPTAPATPPSHEITAENFADLEVVTEVTVETPQFMVWQEDGSLLVASRAEAVRIHPATGESETVYSGAGQERILAISSEGQIATARPDDTGIDIRDLTGAVVSGIDTNGQFGSVDFSGDGSLLAVSRRSEIAADIWNTETGELEQEVTGFETAAPVYSASLGPEGEKLVWHSRATVQITDLLTGDMTPTMDHEDFVAGIALGSDAALLATTWGTFATLWNPDTGERIRDLDQAALALEPAFLPQGELLMVATDGGVRLWDVEGFEALATLDVAARQIAASADGSQLATIDEFGLVTVWAPAGP